MIVHMFASEMCASGHVDSGSRKGVVSYSHCQIPGGGQQVCYTLYRMLSRGVEFIP